MTTPMRRFGQALPVAPEVGLGPAEIDLRRRFLIDGLVAVTALLAAEPAAIGQLPSGRTSTSPEGIVRTLLEHSEDQEGNVFELILDTFPAGVVVPVHHHPVVGLNYVLSGIAQSQYEGEPMRTLRAGDAFQDYAFIPHVLFRNPDQTTPVKVLISHVLRKGQAFFIPGRSSST